MNCPVCDGVRMREVDKDGVLIDICPQCKGVWLDRGELDKLMSGVKEIRDDFNAWHQERYKEQYEQPPYPPQSPQNQPYPGQSPGYQGQYQGQYPNQQKYYGKYDHDHYYKKKKKKNFLDQLGDLFD